MSTISQTRACAIGTLFMCAAISLANAEPSDCVPRGQAGQPSSAAMYAIGDALAMPQVNAPIGAVADLTSPAARARHTAEMADPMRELQALKHQLGALGGPRSAIEFLARGGGDVCAAATAVTELPFYDTGTTCTAADDYNEMCPLPGLGGRDVVYAFTPAADITVDISLCSSSFDTKLYVYEGICPAPGDAIACNEDACGVDGFKSHIAAVALTGGVTYYLVVDGFDSTACGDYVLEIAEAAPPTPGTDCAHPIPVQVPEDLDFTDSNTTCGRGDNYNNTCMDAFDGGEDIIYELVVSAETVVNIEVQAATIWLGMAVDSWCPPDGVSCIASAASVDEPDVIERLTLPPGTYYLMVDTFPAPQCAAFTLNITRAPLGACCREGLCEISYEATCLADGGTYMGDGASCSGDLCRFGACCLADGACADGTTPDECATDGGQYQGHGSTCSATACTQPGDNCHLPLAIELPAQLPFNAAGQSTCGRGDNYSGTCLDPMDRGEDIIYEVTVTSDVCVTVQLQDAAVVWSGIAIGHTCPLEPSDCLGVSATTNLIDRISGLYLPVGTYYIMVDTFPSPDCTPDFALKITESSACTQGACCYRSTCSMAYEETCISQGGVYLGDATDCSGSPCATGACCQLDGSCVQATDAADCDGVFHGNGTSCASVYCAPPGDRCESAMDIPSVPTSLSVDNSTYAADRPGASCDPYGNYPLMQNDAWYRWTADTDGTAVVSVTATGYNMVTTIWEGEDCDNLTELDCANSGTATGNTEQAVFEILPGHTYWIQIGDTGPNPRGGPTTVDISVTTGSGACCNPYNGACTEGTLLECAATGGVYQGNNSTCTAGVCPLPPTDACADAPSFAELTDLPFDTTTATALGPDLPCSTGENVNLWYCYTPSQTGLATVSLCGSGYDTVLAVYDQCACHNTGHPAGDLVACNDDYCNVVSETTIPVLAGESYLVEIGGYDGATGPGVLNISVADGVTGACCVDDDPSCVEVHQLVCELLGGSYAGDATTCTGDVDGNGTPDACDPDCNGNGLIDGCDVRCDGGCATFPSCGQSADCQADSVPDECQLGNHLFHTYQWDDGTHEVATGVSAGGYTGMINRFVASEGATRIGAVSLAWGEVANGTPATVFLWSDPNGDGNPTDAQVLSSATTVVTAANTDIFTTVDIPVTDVGLPGTSFFVGAIIAHAAGEKPGSFDTAEGATAYGQSWIMGDTTTPIDPNNLGLAQGPPANMDEVTSNPGNWLIRAEAAGPDNDCNDNAIPDDCDIAADSTIDCDHNGVIDWCEAGDCNANGVADNCELLSGDCNGNGQPDDCDIDPLDPDGNGAVSADCQPDGVPDECQLGGDEEATVLLQEGFEGEVFPPPGWQNVALNPLGPWQATVNASQIHSGVRAAVHPYAPTTDSADSYLLSPELELTQGILRVWSKGCFGQPWCGNFDIDVMIVVGAPGGSDDIFVANLNGLYADYYQNWVEGVFDLAPLLPGGPVRIGIRYHGIDGDVGMIDDLMVIIPPAPPLNDQDNNGIPDDCEGWRGDADRDGDVDLADLAQFQNCFGVTPLLPQCAIFDLNPNGAIDLADVDACVGLITGPQSQAGPGRPAE